MNPRVMRRKSPKAEPAEKTGAARPEGASVAGGLRPPVASVYAPHDSNAANEDDPDR
jgi:hypothetical protein